MPTTKELVDFRDRIHNALVIRAHAMAQRDAERHWIETDSEAEGLAKLAGLLAALNAALRPKP